MTRNTRTLCALLTALTAACDDTGGGGAGGAGGSQTVADAALGGSPAPPAPDAALGGSPSPPGPDAALGGSPAPPDAAAGGSPTPPPPDAAVSPAPDAALPPEPDAAESPTPDAASPPEPDAGPGPVLGPPIQAPPGTWTWVDFPDTTCDDGSPTGIAVRPGDGPGVVVFLNGGGLCWDAQTCLVLQTSTSGPYGAAQFAQMAPAFAGTLLDPGAPDNPFRGWSFVFVPYCTGDGHTGDRRQQYDAGANALPQDFDHTGGRNLDVFFSRIASTWPVPRRFALVGPSAGGLGALVNYAHVREYWPEGTGLLWSDGFPLLRGDVLPDWLQTAWDTAWGLNGRLTDLCAGCADDPSLVLPTLGALFPDDRFALSGTTRDAVLPGFFGIALDEYTAALADVQANVYAAVPNLHTFTVDGGQHTLLLRPSMVQSAGVTLQTWISQMIAGDPAWVNVGP